MARIDHDDDLSGGREGYLNAERVLLQVRYLLSLLGQQSSWPIPCSDGEGDMLSRVVAPLPIKSRKTC